jgi:hypothetical protein
MRTLFAPLTWLGRVTLWVVFFPLGIWRSLRHGARKDQRKLLKEIRKEQR